MIGSSTQSPRGQAAKGAPALFRPRRRGPWAPVARAITWHRRKLAVLAALTAILSTISALSPADPPTVPVVVANRELIGGRALTGDDLRIAHYPVGLAPSDAVTELRQLEGRVLIGAAGSGSPIGLGAIVAPRDLSPGVGRSLVPVRLDDAAVAGLLQVGDVIDVLATGSGDAPTRTVAAGARVLAFPGPESAAGPLGSASGPPGRLVLLEVSPGEATELVGAQNKDRLAVVLR